MKIAFLILIATWCSAKNLVSDAQILAHLKLSAKDVYVEYPRQQDPENEYLDKDDVVISVREPITYMGNLLPVGAQIFYNPKKGVTSVANFIQGNMVFEGFTCLGQVQFAKQRVCGCSLAAPMKIAKGIELPRRSGLSIRSGQIIWFYVPPGIVEEFSSGFYQKLDDPIVGGVAMKRSKVYSLKNGKVVEQTVQWEHENFCEDLRK